MTRTWFAIIIACASACGESKEEQANREALAPLIHRNRALSEEFTSWFKNNEAVGGVSWQNTLDKYEYVAAAKESLLADTRKIVPTPKYDCLVGVFTRSIQADIDLFQARRSYFKQSLKAKVALELAENAVQEYRAAEYGGRYYLTSAKKSIKEATEAREQANTFKSTSNSNAIRATRTADTLAAVVMAQQVLPSITASGYPITTDSGPDSLFHSAGKLATVPCTK
jgi:hypothetical protein